jgi:hypothetical protein
MTSSCAFGAKAAVAGFFNIHFNYSYSALLARKKYIYDSAYKMDGEGYNYFANASCNF